MPQSASNRIRIPQSDKRTPASGRARKAKSRHTVGLRASVAQEVARYAEMTHTSMSKAIASLVRLGLDSHEARKREFFKKLRSNLANDDPAQEDRLVDEFRSLILGG